MTTLPTVGNQGQTPDLDAMKVAVQRSLAARYTERERDAALRVFYHAKAHFHSSSGATLARLLMGLYNGNRFQFDLTDLRLLDRSNFDAAMAVLTMDATKTCAEIHAVLDALRGPHANTQAEIENWAFWLKHPKRCKKEHLPAIPPCEEVPL